VHDNRRFEKVIDASEVTGTIKKQLKEIGKKLKDKTEEEAITALIDFAKVQGPQVILTILKIAASQPS
jgi:hypothetical protein